MGGVNSGEHSDDVGKYCDGGDMVASTLVVCNYLPYGTLIYDNSYLCST